MFRLNEPKHVAEFLIFLVLITNICCVIDEINLLYYRKTQRDGSYQSHIYCLLLLLVHCSLTPRLILERVRKLRVT